MKTTRYCKDADIVGWIGNIGFVIGALLIASKYVLEGQACNVVANILYFYVSIRTKLPSLLILSFILAIINLIGMMYWSE